MAPTQKPEEPCQRKGRSRSVSRILYSRTSRPDRMTIPLGPTLPPGSSGLPVPPAPGGTRAGHSLPCRCSKAAAMGRDLFGLAPGGVCQADMSPCRWCALTAPFHPYPRGRSATLSRSLAADGLTWAVSFLWHCP